MGVVDTSIILMRDEQLDAVWIQVGAFMELHGDPALAMNKSFGLAIWLRDSVPTVGVPVTHIEKWAQKTTELGLRTGLAFQVAAGYKVSRELDRVLPSIQGNPQFSATANPEHLGSPAGHDHKLQANQIFSTSVPGIFTPTQTFRKLCDGRYCDHSSQIVVCIPIDSTDATDYLYEATGARIYAIYPEAW
jgi:hypothetical protein